MLREIGEMARGDAGCGSRTSSTPATGTSTRSSSTTPATPGEEERAAKLGGEILRLCIRSGGSITGEHGVGAEKAQYMAEQFDEDDLDTMERVRCAFDGVAAHEPRQGLPDARGSAARSPAPTVPTPPRSAGLAERW